MPMNWRGIGWHWNALGRTNPFGAIITCGGSPKAEWDTDEFFATGRADAARFVADLARLQPAHRCRTALDFGCGVGRITRPLADHFEAVVGIDIAGSMIGRARGLNRDSPRCRFVLNRAPDLRMFASGTFDVAYSRLVLQHMPPETIKQYVPELIRVLAPGGVLMFQLPTEIPFVDAERLYVEAPILGPAWKRQLPKALVHVHRLVKYRLFVAPIPRMDMFGLPRDAVLELIRHAGGVALAVVPDQSHGAGVPGFEYWVLKP